MGRIIVGLDGSPYSLEALGWAVARASGRGDEVVAVMAWHLFAQGFHRKGESLRGDFDADAARSLLTDAVATAGLADLVELRTIEGVPAEVLVEEAGDDGMLVVGARGTGGFEGLLLGSVSTRVLQLARCPVAVIHGPVTASNGEIVVGVDGSASSIRAVDWAADEARATDAAVRLVLAWQAPLYPEMSVPQILDALEGGAREEVGELAGSPSLAGLEVTTETPCESAARALLAHDDAAMIVVGKRGHGALLRVLLGSVSAQVARHATVPVVVV
ncbi:MAG: universal stress protein [Actinobacteria bacterium]|nr:universal stress protein [Actinomycetota bacterium]